MRKNQVSKILNDPVYGFITLNKGILLNIVDHPFFQRLSRIKQLGLTYLVYPGAHHTRFHHAIGAAHLMGQAIHTLQENGFSISEEERTSVTLAILLHDIGHGPFSHALEHSFVEGINHENISSLFMESLNKELDGALDMAIEIFDNRYPKKFLHHLVSSQLDMDRLDYLKRDSFFTGVSEGVVSNQRIIKMFSIVNDEIVIKEKGIYSIEKFIVARRLMYWQVYLHKTGIVAEHMLVNVLMRAKELAEQKVDLFGSKALQFFLYNKVNETNFDDEVLDVFSKLDDYDVLSAIKEWSYHSDKVLSRLSSMIVNRALLKIEVFDDEVPESYKDKISELLVNQSDISLNEARYFVFVGEISNQAYNKKLPIKILNKNRKLEDIAEASDQLNLQALSKPVTKYFICYPKKMILA